jgi:hypothetical protein
MGQPEEAAAQCERLCLQALDRDQQSMAAHCVTYESCAAIEKCVTSLPGA